MTVRKALTVSLLLFVGTGVVTVAVKELRATRVTAGSPAAAPRESLERGSRIVAYYFLGTVRCSSCRKIEEVSRRTIEESFPREMADGRLKFLAVNVDQPENRHFVEEFRLDGSALVLVEMRDGKPVDWKALPEVWILVEDPRKLVEHIRSEIASGLERI